MSMIKDTKYRKRPAASGYFGRNLGRPAQFEPAFMFGHPTPDPVRLTSTQRVFTTLSQHRTTRAHRLGTLFPPGSNRTPFMLVHEEHRTVQLAAQPPQLPVPTFRNRPGQPLSVNHPKLTSAIGDNRHIGSTPPWLRQTSGGAVIRVRPVGQDVRRAPCPGR